MKQLKGEINLQLKKLQGTHSYKIENIGFSWSHFIIKYFFSYSGKQVRYSDY